MSELFDRLRSALPNLVFHPPATSEQIAHVEKELGTNFPQWLHDLYLCTNGIENPDCGDTYLFPLEGSQQSLLEWNKFVRSLYEENLPNPPGLHLADYTDAPVAPRVSDIILITYMNTIEWAIDPKRGMAIIYHDIRAPDYRPIVGVDLVEACLKDVRKDQEIRNELFRGREPLHRLSDPPQPSCDAEYIYDMLIDLHRGSISQQPHLRYSGHPNGCLYRAISQRSGEPGVLHILEWRTIEVQLASRDGNIPFILRCELGPARDAMTCLVKALPDALLCILLLIDLEYNIANALADSIKQERIASVWHHRYGPPDPELESMATVLFRRDDTRLEDDNPLGA